MEDKAIPLADKANVFKSKESREAGEMVYWRRRARTVLILLIGGPREIQDRRVILYIYMYNGVSPESLSRQRCGCSGGWWQSEA